MSRIIFAIFVISIFSACDTGGCYLQHRDSRLPYSRSSYKAGHRGMHAKRSHHRARPHKAQKYLASLIKRIKMHCQKNKQ